ncbi:recombinase family protein [Cyanobacterium sp. Dongsha4]|uniref:recombinase family protein n=1 Tax=Cyanobacterium sp. DS4 TaxID=2878255 RepID=UPI002E7FD631|nr:recombinase family protein [Cyanobacterium sp. Dongsha4]WVL01123.1 recombinase family protein [Cyanobacterium sp. Dongsha4]
MRIVAYSYIELLIDSIPDPQIWGWEIEEIYQDIDTREKLSQLLFDSQDNAPDYLLINSLHELGNSLTEVENNIFRLESLSIEIISLQQDYHSKNFQNINNIKQRKKLLEIWQEIENLIKHRKLKKAHAKNRLNIIPPPGKPPYGYSRGKEGYIVNRATAPIIRAFFDRFLLYGSLQDTVNYLAEKYNKKISISTAKYWLNNPIYRGDLNYKNQQIIPDTHTAIITREESAQIERIFQSHRRVKQKSASSQHCLAGLIQCQWCKSNFRVNTVTKRNKSAKYLYLTPVECKKEIPCKSINYDLVLQKVIDNICNSFKEIKNQEQMPNIEQIKNYLLTEINQKKIVITQIEKLLEEKILDEETAKIRIYKIKQDIGVLKQQIAKLPPNSLNTIANTLSLPQFWYDLSSSEKRFYLREFVKIIEIIPQNNYPQKKDVQLNFVFANAQLNNSWQNREKV